MTFAPIFLQSQPAASVPLAYVIHIRPTRCLCCSTLTEHSEVYAVNEMRSRTGAGKWVMNMTPVSRLDYQLPTRVHRLSLREVPLCHECVGTAIAGAAMQHLPDGLALREWQATLARKEAEAARAAESPPAKRQQAARDPRTILNIL